MLVGVLLVGVVALIGSYTFLPPLVEGVTGWAIQRNLGLDDGPGVKLKSDPPPNILAGDFVEGQVDMSGLDLDGVRPDSLRIDLDPFNVNVLKSAASGSLRAEKPLSGDMRVEFSEKGVAEIARSRVEQFPVTGVKLSPDRILVSSKAQALGFDIPVSVEGGLAVRSNEMVFTPQKVRAFGVPLPKTIADSLLAGTDFTYPLDGLPYDTKINTVRIEDGRIILTGKIKGIPVGSSGG